MTGISNEALYALQRNLVRTMEIRSPHNFLAILAAEPGSTVFLTHTSAEDVKTGTYGLLAQVKGKQILMHRILHQTQEVYEEREVQVARVQLELKSQGRVRKVECCNPGEAMVVDADEITYFEAR